MIDKEEKILRKYLDNNQMVVLMQNDLLHLVAMAMRCYKNEDKLVKNLTIHSVSKCIEGYKIIIDVMNNDCWQDHYNRKIYKSEEVAKEAMINWNVKYKILPLYIC